MRIRLNKESLESRTTAGKKSQGKSYAADEKW